MADPLPAFLAITPAQLRAWLDQLTRGTTDPHELRCITACRWLVQAVPEPPERPFDDTQPSPTTRSTSFPDAKI